MALIRTRVRLALKRADQLMAAAGVSWMHAPREVRRLYVDEAHAQLECELGQVLAPEERARARQAFREALRRKSELAGI